MVEIHKSDTGRFVLIHEPSDTVVVDESLEEGFRRLEAAAKEKDPAHGGDVTRAKPETEKKVSNDGRVRLGLLLFLVLLPFLWLGILHYSIGSLIDEYLVQRDRLVREEGRFATTDDIRQVQIDLNQLAQRIQAAPPAPGGSDSDAEK